MNKLDQLESAHVRDDIPEFKGGDTGRERVQVFEGVVIARKGGGVNDMCTVRKVSFGVGVERVFPVHAPIIHKIEVVRKGDVRRAKLYYLRHRVGKAARIKEQR